MLHSHDDLFSQPLDNHVLDRCRVARVAVAAAVHVAAATAAVRVVGVAADVKNLDFRLGASGEQVVDALIIDLQVREAQQEFHLRVARNVTEDVLHTQLHDARVVLVSLLQHKHTHN